DDVGAGFAAYKDVLARWGEWSPDESYGVHWCPRPGAAFPAAAPFQPYRERGHWDAKEDASTYGAPPGSPSWVSDDGETAGESPGRHGWWVQVPDDKDVLSQISPWCWVPGIEETPARVVWRSGGGFLGWAPEPPSWIDDGDEGLYAYFEWTFVMEGGLLEDDLDDQCLDGDAQLVAANATSRNPVVQVFDPTSGKWGEEKKKSASLQRFARIGPNMREVRDAKKALVAYAQNHPEIKDAAPAQASAPSSSASSSSSS